MGASQLDADRRPQLAVVNFNNRFAFAGMHSRCGSFFGTGFRSVQPVLKARPRRVARHR